MLAFSAPLVDAHVHLSFATRGRDPDPAGSAEIQRRFLTEQAAAGVDLVRDCGAVPGSAPPPIGPGLPRVLECGPLLAPDGPFLAHLREPVAPDDLIATATALIRAGAPWVKVLADAPGRDGNMVAARPTYRAELIGRLCDAVHAAGGRVAVHTTGVAARKLVGVGVDSIEHGNWLDAPAVARLGARGGAWTPTLTTALFHLQPLIDRGLPGATTLQAHLDALAKALSGAVAAGVVVLAGTDEMAHGSVRDEAEALHAYGLTEHDAVAAASSAARDYLLSG